MLHHYHPGERARKKHGERDLSAKLDSTWPRLIPQIGLSVDCHPRFKVKMQNLSVTLFRAGTNYYKACGVVVL